MAASDLTETIARAFALACDDTDPYDGEHSEDYICDMEDGARAVVAALGLREEARGRHVYYAYGREFEGHGPSMDPHRCGHPDETCRSWTERRYVTDWEEVTDV